MNGFERHGIDHLSGSSINKSIEDMSAWCVSYLMRQRFPGSAAADRGKSVEIGVAHGLFNPDVTIKECVELGVETYKQYNQAAFNLNAEEIEKEQQNVEAMIPMALAELRPLGVPTPAEGTNQHQVNLEYCFDGDDDVVNITGFLDFYYADQPLIVDLKTTKRSPSGWSQPHALTASIYSVAMQSPVKYLYVTPKKTVWLELDEFTLTEHMTLMRESIRRLERFLSLSDDAEKLTKSAPHNPSSFYWRGAGDLLELIK